VEVIGGVSGASVYQDDMSNKEEGDEVRDGGV
jgi:hypothetical protein